MEKQHNVGWNPQQSYLGLSDKLFQSVLPQKPLAPEWVVFNQDLAVELGLQTDETAKNHLLATLSGADCLPFETPIAQAYAGHQFGHFTILGDGRAVLLGEHALHDGKVVDVQLKGSGETPYSRRGDGKATLRSMLREYVVSEAMFNLGISSTRSLAVVKTGDEVYREYVHDGAVLTRLAQSHIRVGTFEFASLMLNGLEFKAFADYVIARHYPELSDLGNPYLELLKSVMFRQIDLIVEWMRVGFIHGVMNTDNMSIAGETIDYGPCAFMNAYDPKTVFSSIDQNGRYAFENQPGIAQWNLACFGGSLFALIDADKEKALEMAQSVIHQFPAIFQQKWTKMMGKKLGFKNLGETEQQLIVEFLELLQSCHADYNNSFLLLMGIELDGVERLKNDERFSVWLERWHSIAFDADAQKPFELETMTKTNPKVLPRNHVLENALNKAEQGEMFELEDLLKVLKNPYAEVPERFYAAPPPDGGKNYRTFCGT